MNGNIDAVAIAFDCNPDTIRKYYAGLNKKQVARDVLGKLQARPVPIFPEEEPTETSLKVTIQCLRVNSSRPGRPGIGWSLRRFTRAYMAWIVVRM